jgi:O-acetyl-ADP-ribose deacetylase (regulator of RNase III)
MITYVKGNLFTSPAKVLTNTVNTVGVMGKGIAKTAKEIYPEMFRRYQELCERKQLTVGTLWLYKTPHKWILNFPTKAHWRQPSKPEYIEAGLKKFVMIYASQGITSIAFPRLGCGNGELDWETVVQPLMVAYLDKLPIDVFVYSFGEITSLPEHKDPAAMKVWLRSEPHELAFGEIWEDLVAAIGSGLQLTMWDGSGDFHVKLTEGNAGLRINTGNPTVTIWTQICEVLARSLPNRWRLRLLGHGNIFVPREALLDLWQAVRSYGFCVPRIMPSGLDILSSYILPIMALLPYLRRVELSTRTASNSSMTQIGLEFISLFAEDRKLIKERPDNVLEAI